MMVRLIRYKLAALSCNIRLVSSFIRFSVVVASLSFMSTVSAIPGTDISLLKVLANLVEVKAQTSTSTTETMKPFSAEFVQTVIARKGYDNQPYFESSNSLLFTRQDGEQTDIYRLDLLNHKVTALTRTNVSEYSPTPLGPDSFSTVVADNGKQTLWTYRSGKAVEKVSGAVEPVGYHAWLSPSQLMMFRLAEPHELVLFDRESGKSRVVAKDIGRTLIADNAGQVYFAQRQSDGMYLASYQASTDAVTLLAKLMADREDFAWHRNLGFISSDGKQLYYLDAATSQWRLIDVTLPESIQDITRLAIAPNGQAIAIVHSDVDSTSLGSGSVHSGSGQSNSDQSNSSDRDSE